MKCQKCVVFLCLFWNFMSLLVWRLWCKHFASLCYFFHHKFSSKELLCHKLIKQPDCFLSSELCLVYVSLLDISKSKTLPQTDNNCQANRNNFKHVDAHRAGKHTASVVANKVFDGNTAAKAAGWLNLRAAFRSMTGPISILFLLLQPGEGGWVGFRCNKSKKLLTVLLLLTGSS